MHVLYHRFDYFETWNNNNNDNNNNNNNNHVSIFRNYVESYSF